MRLQPVLDAGAASLSAYVSFSFLVALSVFSSATPARAQDASSCAAVHIIAARASLEPPGPGVISSLAALLSAAVAGSTSEALVYPASLPYSGSLPQGVLAMKAAIANYTLRCPASKLVLMGYSQGGAVIGDALCGGGGGDVGPVTVGLSAVEGKAVVAAVLMGDPRFVPGVQYGVGNATRGGIIERDRTVAQCPAFASRMVSYCDADDLRCASGNSLAIHMGYTKEYNQQALAFIMDKMKAETTTSGSSSSSGLTSSSSQGLAKITGPSAASPSTVAVSNDGSKNGIGLLVAALAEMLYVLGV